jgi:beta-phosphoglucomutase
MPAKNPIHTILFDLDGVLWFSTDAHRFAFQRALKELKLPWEMTRAQFSHVAGMTTEKAFLEWMKPHRVRVSKQLLDRFSHRKRYWALHYLARNAPLQKRLVSTLRRLGQTRTLGLVSASHPRTVSLFLKRSGTRRFFKVVLSSREIPVSKPSPRGYITALRRLGATANTALAVEDTISGIQAAKGARIQVLGMRGTCDPAQLRRAGAFALVNSISDLLRYAPDR